MSLNTAVAIAKSGTRIGAVPIEKQSFSHFLNCCSDNFTENEVAQEELNTGPTTPYQTFVFKHGSRNRKKVALALGVVMVIIFRSDEPSLMFQNWVSSVKTLTKNLTDRDDKYISLFLNRGEC
jgi:hypothetical protein